MFDVYFPSLWMYNWHEICETKCVKDLKLNTNLVKWHADVSSLLLLGRVIHHTDNNHQIWTWQEKNIKCRKRKLLPKRNFMAPQYFFLFQLLCTSMTFYKLLFWSILMLYQYYTNMCTIIWNDTDILWKWRITRNVGRKIVSRILWYMRFIYLSVSFIVSLYNWNQILFATSYLT